jgi:protein ImuA
LSLSETGVVLQNGRVHEVCGSAADAFAVTIAARLMGPLIWIGGEKQVGSLSPTALQDFFDPARVLTVSCQTRKETLWAAEQALRCGGAAGAALGVIIEMNMGPNLTESRRLQLAAEAGRSLGLVLIGKRAQSSAAQTRWQCEALPQDASWKWSLQKNKSGPVGTWNVTWQQNGKQTEKRREANGPSGDVHMVAAPAA